MSSIIRNAIKTPDGTILVSRNRHDYKTHLDANGKLYMIDGGLEYQRMSTHDDCENLLVTIDEPHSVVREALEWGTYGPKGDQPLSYILLKDMETDHIINCLKIIGISSWPQLEIALKNELKFRGIE